MKLELCLRPYFFGVSALTLCHIHRLQLALARGAGGEGGAYREECIITPKIVHHGASHRIDPARFHVKLLYKGLNPFHIMLLGNIIPYLE